jgi:predicted nucleic acid-binding protein
LLFVSVVTVMEIESGIRQYARRGSPRRVDELSRWRAALMTDFKDKLLTFDEEAAMVAGRLEASAVAKGRHPVLADIVIAAIGEVNGLTILTQNLRHFRPLDVPSINPFAHLP